MDPLGCHSSWVYSTWLPTRICWRDTRLSESMDPEDLSNCHEDENSQVPDTSIMGWVEKCSQVICELLSTELLQWGAFRSSSQKFCVYTQSSDNVMSSSQCWSNSSYRWKKTTNSSQIFAKHLIILHGSSRHSRYILKDIHQNLLHAGHQHMTADNGQQNHILFGKKLALSVYRSCVSCTKKQAKTVNQLMGQLPTYRCVIGYPFLHTWIDYAGPINIKLWRVRKPVYIWSYICIFFSMSVKAIHLELVSDHTTEAFIAAISRLITRYY